MTTGQPRLFTVEQEQFTSDDYYTPAWVFERMGIEFDLDVCAPPGGIPWIPAKRYYTQADDGLLQPWEGRVWMNPPYSEPRPWIERFIAHAHGVTLVPASNGRWFHTLWGEADAMVPATDVAMKFATASGLPGGLPIRVFFAAFGPECVEAIGRLGVVRVRA